MEIFLSSVFLVVGLVILIFGGDFLVRGATNIAYKAKLSPLVVGLTIVAFGTSAPELVVSLTSALGGKPGIAMGNVVGSNICNLTLVMGATAIFYPIHVKANSIKIDWIVTFGSSFLLYFFVSNDSSLQHFEGIILFLIVIIYTYFLIETSRRETMDGEAALAASKEHHEIDKEVEEALKSNTFKEIGFILAGCLALYFGGNLFVQNAEQIAQYLNVDDEIIGLTVIAFGTSAPELVTSIIAAKNKNTDLALGNLLGSCIFNVLSILGITSIIENITMPLDSHLISFDMVVMLGVILLVLPMMITRKKISTMEGVILLAVYVGYTTFKVYQVVIA